MPIEKSLTLFQGDEWKVDCTLLETYAHTHLQNKHILPNLLESNRSMQMCALLISSTHLHANTRFCTSAQPTKTMRGIEAANYS